jgi:hypothetical protein
MTSRRQWAWPHLWQRVVLFVLALANVWASWDYFHDGRLFRSFIHTAAPCVLLILALYPGRKARGHVDDLP